MKITDLMEAKKHSTRVILINKWEDGAQINTDITIKIQKECSKYLKVFDATHRVLYRGTKKTGVIFEGESIENRRPMDSSKSDTLRYDNLMTLLGIKALRSNSIFTTSSLDSSSDYGQISYVIIPKNTAVFSWSRIHNDLILDHMGSYVKDYPKEITNVIDSEIERADKEYNNLVWKLKSTLIDYKFKLYEILGFTEKSTIVDNLKWISLKFPESPVLKYTRELLNREPDLDSFQKKFRVTNKNFPAALKSENEVLIHGAYFAILEKYFFEFQTIRRKLGYTK